MPTWDTGASRSIIETTHWLSSVTAGPTSISGDQFIRRIGSGVYQGKEMGIRGDGMGEYNSVIRIV